MFAVCGPAPHRPSKRPPQFQTRQLEALDFVVRAKVLVLSCTLLLTALFAVTAHAAEAQAQVPAATNKNPAKAEAPIDSLAPTALLQIPLGSGFYPPYAFVVDKQARTLTVWQQTENGLKSVASFPADLGRATGEKSRRNDLKTPEGIYFLLERREGANLDFNLYGKRAFTTDYPNFFDRSEGKTGDGIWLHAVPDEVALTRGSHGCVVVRNDVIMNLSQYVKLGRTPILIQNQTDLAPSKDISQKTQEVVQWLEAWRASWETKNIDHYMQHYADEFRSNHMNVAQWRRYKQRLNRVYGAINVRLSRPVIFVERNRAIVRFLQEYASDKHTDIGEKVLHLKRVANGYQILGESWAEESSEIARQEIDAAKKATTLSCAGGDGVDCIRSPASSAQ